MPEWMDETEKTAYDYLKAFGFADEQISPLLVQARKDMEQEYEKFRALVAQTPCPAGELNRVLHALKGLLFHLGNHALAEQLDEIRGTDLEQRCDELKRLLL